MSTAKKHPDNPDFKDGVDYSWQTTKEFNDLVKNFRDKSTLSPKMKEAKQMHTVIIDELKLKLKEMKEKPLRWSRLQYTGSAYEGVNVSKGKDDDDLEFDIMVIIEGGRDLKKDSSETPPGYVLLKPSQESGMQRFQKQTTDGYVSADKVAAHFMGQLKTCINEIQMENSQHEEAPDELRHIKDNIKLRKHGPAIQMDVFRSSPSESDREKPFYSVDMVPTFEMVLKGGQKEYYVAKPVKGVDFAKEPKMKFAWRRSFSLDEKELIINMDKNNTCKKAIFRMLKVIRNRECGLALLTSYHLKTVLLREINDKPNDDDWKEDLIGRRLMDVISRLINELGSEMTIRRRRPAALVLGVRSQRQLKKDRSMKRVFRKGQMPQLFIPQINLLDSIVDDRACECIYYRLKHLKNSQQQMEAILNGDSKPRKKKKATTTKKRVAVKQRTHTVQQLPDASLNPFMLLLNLLRLRDAQMNHLLFDTQYSDSDDCDSDADDDFDHSDMFSDSDDNFYFDSDF